MVAAEPALTNVPPPPEPAPAASLPNVMPALRPWTRSMVPALPTFRSVPSPPTPAPAAALPNVMPRCEPATRSMVSAEPAESSVMPPTPAPAAELPKVMPPRLPWTRSMVSAEPAESSVMPPTPAPAAELPKVMPLEDSPTRSIVPDDPCMSIEPRSARACRSFCSSVHTRVFFVAYLFLPKTGTATPWAWHRPPRDSSVLSTSFRQSPSSKSFLAPKQSDAGMPMAWQPLRNMLMLSICRKAMVDSETFLTLPGLIALISLHSRTCGRAASARGARNCGDAAARPGLQVREETERVVERVVRHRLDPGLRLLRVVH